MSMSQSPLLDSVARLLLYIAAAAMLVMMLHIFSDIISNLITGRSLIGTNEMVTYYYMVAVVFLPLSYVQVLRKQVIVEIFTHNLSPLKILFIDLLASIFGFIYMSIMAYAATREAILQAVVGEYSLALHFSVITWPARLIFALSCIAMVSIMIRNLLIDFKKLNEFEN